VTNSSKLTTRSLELQVYETIRDEITRGVLRPGEPLVESQLSEVFGISKTPVREALIRLKRDGLVEASPHRVNRVTTPTAEDIEQACEVRIWIESALAASCAEVQAPENLKQLERTIELAREALESGDDAAYGEAIRGFSDVIIEISGNRYAADALERLRNVVSLIGHISRKAAGRRARSINEHIAIFEAIRAGDSVAAAAATRAHLESIEQDSLQALSQLEIQN
jgi:DNA-binding GntR family transcriptional regulator